MATSRLMTAVSRVAVLAVSHVAIQEAEAFIERAQRRSTSRAAEIRRLKAENYADAEVGRAWWLWLWLLIPVAGVVIFLEYRRLRSEAAFAHAVRELEQLEEMSR